jgi:hypothetical protein
MFSPGAAKRERHRQRVAAMHARSDAALATKAEKLGVTVHELKRGIAAAAQQMSEAPARARAQRHAELEAADNALHAKMDASSADYAAWREQQEAERAAIKGSSFIFIDHELEQRILALQESGQRDEATRLIRQAVRDGLACEVPE